MSAIFARLFKTNATPAWQVMDEDEGDGRVVQFLWVVARKAIPRAVTSYRSSQCRMPLGRTVGLTRVRTSASSNRTTRHVGVLLSDRVSAERARRTAVLPLTTAMWPRGVTTSWCFAPSPHFRDGAGTDDATEYGGVRWSAPSTRSDGRVSTPGVRQVPVAIPSNERPLCSAMTSVSFGACLCVVAGRAASSEAGWRAGHRGGQEYLLRRWPKLRHEDHQN